MPTANKIHAKAGALREAQKFEEAFIKIIEAILAYQKEKDYVGLTDAEGNASLTLRHLYKKTGDNVYLILAEGFANSAVETAGAKNLKGDMARPLFNLAKVIEEMGGFPLAVEKYKEAIAVFETQNPKLHNRSGVLADMKIHLATCEYRNGNKLALGDALLAISDLEKSSESQVSKYNYIVWLSGANMRLAEVLLADDKKLARKHLETAKKLIDENINELPDLKLRKSQWEDLNAKF